MSQVLTFVMLALVGCGRTGFGSAVDAADSDRGRDGPSATSCGALANTCGPTQTGNCCESPMVGGGAYYRAYDTAADLAWSDMTHPSTVSDFRLDKYEITVGRFRQFVVAEQGTQANPPAAGIGAHDRIPGSGWDASWNASLAADTTALVAAIKCDPRYQTWTDTPGGNESRPMNCISWYDAMAFCAWDGGHLPTEAEWNYAATGGNLQRAYPWASPPSSLTIDGSHASYSSGAPDYCLGDGVPFCTVSDLVPVGSKPAGDGVWGQSDLAGNVWEWALDWYDGGTNSYPNPCSDCANLTSATYRVDRGGSFEVLETYLRGAFRDVSRPTLRYFGLGARCARTP